MFFPLKPAKLRWQDSAPYSDEYQDVYFSPAGGVDETLAVFLAANQLPQRWQDVTPFTIVETGFGTGLNFLVTLQQWGKHAPSNAHLSYVAIEKSPLELMDLKRALSAWPELKHESEQLLTRYPQCVAGFHRCEFIDQRVSLTLVYADVEQALDALFPMQADAWYLDGFAPSRNPQMWNENLYQQMARLSAPGATFGTFTAASSVRRGLQEVGFDVEKKPGFAGKRERLQGRFAGEQTRQSLNAPWFYLPSALPPTSQQAIVVGGGISGVSVARTLCQRGWQVNVLEGKAQLASGASGNLAGVVMPRLATDMALDGQFFLSAFLFTVNWLDEFNAKFGANIPWFKSGVIALCEDDKANKLAAWAMPDTILQHVDAHQVAKLSGVASQSGGVYYPAAGYLDPAALIQCLAEKTPDIQIQTNTFVERIERCGDAWRVHCGNGEEYTTRTLILTNSDDAARLLGTDDLFLMRMRGQLSYLDESQIAQPVAMPVCANAYVIPAYQGKHCIGATYAKDDAEKQLRASDHEANIQALTSMLALNIEAENVQDGRVSWRAMTRDFLPIVGPVPDFDYYRQQYPAIKHGRPDKSFPAAQHLPGLWMMTGMGSRGLVSAPYAAVLLADMIEGKPRCAHQAMVHALHPGRFLIRKLKKSLL